jgi:hypothetical protein
MTKRIRKMAETHESWRTGSVGSHEVGQLQARGGIQLAREHTWVGWRDWLDRLRSWVVQVMDQ